MLRMNKDGKTFTPLAKVTLPDAGITERYDLQAMIKNCPDVFFQEMGEKLMLIGEEVRPSDEVEDRIDLFAIDSEGTSVIIELKRGNHKLQLLQALSYAAMVSDWSPEDILAQYGKFISSDGAQDKVEAFLVEDLDSLNKLQRVILLAEGFDYEVLVTAEWLTKNYGMNIKCFRLTIAAEKDGNEYLNCTCIFPAPEISEQVVRRGRQKAATQTEPKNWEDVLAGIENSTVEDFFRNELARDTENHVGHKDLFYRVNGKREYFVGARTKNAYVWQYHRFADDINFWKARISRPDSVSATNDEQCLRFFLFTQEDFQVFKQAVSQELGNTKFE